LFDHFWELSQDEFVLGWSAAIDDHFEHLNNKVSWNDLCLLNEPSELHTDGSASLVLTFHALLDIKVDKTMLF